MRNRASWFEIAVIKPATLEQNTIDRLEEHVAEGKNETLLYFKGLGYKSAISHRYLATNNAINHYSYNFVAMDIRRSTQGVKEWLKSIEPGDILSVYARVPEDSNVFNSVSSVKITLYWEP